MLLCPRDRTRLRTRTYEGDVHADICPSCGGVWLESAELERVQETLEHDYAGELGGIAAVAQAYEMARQKARPDIACPRCAEPLSPSEYGYCSRILIDACRRCGGHWLDAGEIQALEQFFERARADVSRSSASTLRRAFWASLRQSRRP